ncbi:restriction endonuclease PLD domain-containing protein [Thiomonas sp.]
MSNKFNIKGNKSGKLIELLSKTDKRKVHDLYLCSCYFSVDAIKSINQDIQKEKSIKINNTYVYVDRRAALSARPYDIQKIKSWESKNSNFSLRVVDSSALFHTKAYALISCKEDKPSGSLVIGSANLTGNGLTNGKLGNIESLLDTQDAEVISDFLSRIKSIKVIGIDELTKFTSSDSVSFAYALLRQGNFSHKWSDNIGQYLSVRHVLNKKGRSELSNSELINLGFNVDAASIGKRYFDFEYEPLHLKGLENLIRNFGIETYLGHWIPSSAIKTLFNDADYDKFCKKLSDYWIKEKLALITKINNDFDKLLQLEYVDKPENSPGDAFESKVNDLLDNEMKLYRAYAKFEFYNLPYDISQDDYILSLNEEIQDFIASRVKKNKAMKAYEEAISSSSLAPVQDITNDSLVNDN